MPTQPSPLPPAPRLLAQRPREFHTPPQSRARGRFTRSSLRLALELFGIFVGVSAAFMGENYRENVERDKQARQIYSALSQEVEDFVIRGQRLHDLEAARIGALEGGRAGDTAAPPPPAHSAERPSRAAWDATVASGAIRLIDPALFYQLAQHYERVSMHDARRERLEVLDDAAAAREPQTVALAGRRRALLRENQENIQMASPLLAELRRRVTAR